MIRIENLKLIFTYSIVGFIVVAGFYVIYQAATHSLPEGSDRAALYTMIGGFVGACIQFVTGNEIATRSVNASVRAFSAAQTGTQPTVTASQNGGVQTLTSKPQSGPTSDPPTDT